MRRTLAGVLSLAGCLALVICALLGAVQLVGTNGAAYPALQERCGVTEAIGISREDLVRLDLALGQYLAGDEGALDLRAEVWGVEQQAFGPRELAHMADVLALFRLLRRALAALLPGGLLLILGSFALAGRGALRGLLSRWLGALALLLAPLTGFALWAALDFDAAFTAFHRVLFRNDLWLLDPETDLMIRMLPEGFFAAMGARIGLLSLGFIALGAAALAGLKRICEEK